MPREATPEPEMLTIAKAAELLRAPVATLRYWRQLGTGPRSFGGGRRVLHRRDDLYAWMETSVPGSTSASDHSADWTQGHLGPGSAVPGDFVGISHARVRKPLRNAPTRLSRPVRGRSWIDWRRRPVTSG